ncbi:hypothetical protein PLICRDRAFT_92459 [Plicaturopsis crispa FD-325 SS-3]|nr:hypothetical protein PLICRDRAFT_92459 [Plicaturopsis crispa FD-325 SS-3]
MMQSGMWTCGNCGTAVVQKPRPLPDHPCPMLTATNDMPSQLEIPHLRQDLLQAETDLCDVNAEIERLQAALANLEREQQELQGRVAVNRGILSPLRRLPNELLSHIFIECLPEQIPLVHMKVFCLGSVCHKWWSVALSTPQLWTSVAVGRRQRQYAAAEVWLRRAGQLPLALECLKVPSVPDIVPLIADYASRWRHLDLLFETIPRSLAEAGSAGFPGLRSLSLTLRSDSVASGKCDVFRLSPELRQVYYYNECSNDLRLDIPWGQLTHLSLCYQAEYHCISILSQTPNLVECDFQHMVDWEPAWEVYKEPLHMQHLKCLRMSCEGENLLFQETTMPALQELFVCSTNAAQIDIPHGSFLSFLERSRCSMTRLTLDLMYIPEGEFVECLRHLPSLRILEITENVDPDDGFAMFRNLAISSLDRNQSSSAGPCLPELRVLKLHDLWVDTEALARMLRSRWRPHDQSALADLEHAQFDREYVRAMPESDLAPLRQLKREGFNIDLPPYEPPKVRAPCSDRSLLSNSMSCTGLQGPKRDSE